ncbi:calcium homeostasis modulator protein 3-like [Ambystoma mexicanum]|uniref:calcium homeostasis modulator protein 3-like n=1 Tax=Ambystoma mexicanum TaxID=8296 RepID=UPI0037E9A083
MEHVLKYLQSTSESTMNVICGIVILIAMKIFITFEFKCPCLPSFNRIYGLGAMVLPPLIFFLIGVLINKYTIMLLEEMVRPPGPREKNKAVSKRFFISMMVRALAAPIMWILISLLDGKFVICAFSESVDPEPFLSLSNATGIDVALLLAKIPCKEMEPLRNTTIRKAAARYLKFLSQAIGLSTILLFIFLGAMGRVVGPLFSSPASVQARYWACYSDMEQKYFEEACIKQNYDYADDNMKCFFESYAKSRRKTPSSSLGEMEVFAEKRDFYPVPYPDHLMKILETWCECKPAVAIRTNEAPF